MCSPIISRLGMKSQPEFMMITRPQNPYGRKDFPNHKVRVFSGGEQACKCLFIGIQGRQFLSASCFW
jgi:hypothetical protein